MEMEENSQKMMKWMEIDSIGSENEEDLTGPNIVLTQTTLS